MFDRNIWFGICVVSNGVHFFDMGVAVLLSTKWEKINSIDFLRRHISINSIFQTERERESYRKSIFMLIKYIIQFINRKYALKLIRFYLSDFNYTVNDIRPFYLFVWMNGMFAAVNFVQQPQFDELTSILFLKLLLYQWLKSHSMKCAHIIQDCTIHIQLVHIILNHCVL